LFQVDANNPAPVTGKFGGIKQPGSRCAPQVEDPVALFNQQVLLLNFLQLVNGSGRETLFFRPARVMILPLIFFSMQLAS